MMSKLRAASVVVLVALLVGVGQLIADDCNFLSPSDTPCSACKQAGLDNDNNGCQGAFNPGDCTYFKVTHGIPTNCEYLDGSENCTMSNTPLKVLCCDYATCRWVTGQCTWDANGIVVQDYTMNNWALGIACKTQQ